MHNLEFYIIQEKKVVHPDYTYSGVSEVYSTVSDISKQSKLLKLDYLLNSGSLSEIPRKTDSFLFVVLDENSLIPADYLSRILSINNLHRDAACFCGPRATRPSRVNLELANFLKLYENYSLDSFSTFISCVLNSQNWLYPFMSGCIFSGRHYNSVGGYSELLSPRGPVNSIEFFGRIDKSGPIVYSECLKTYKYLTEDHLGRESMASWCYQQGFLDKSIDRHSCLEIVLDMPETQDLLHMYKLGTFENVSKMKLF